MKRKHLHEEDADNHERWLLSYADFITLLFALFVVMYALSTINQAKYKVFSDSITHAFDNAKSGITILPGQQGIKPESSEPLSAIAKIKKEKQIADGRKLLAVVIQTLTPMINEGIIHVVQTNRGIRIDISDNVLFTPGSARLENANAVKTLQKIAPLVLNTGQPIEIEGHTDNVPIKNQEFASNWELSAIRATSVLTVFSESGIADERLSAIGYGSSKPIASNDTPAGRSDNRRVSIMILRESNY